MAQLGFEKVVGDGQGGWKFVDEAAAGFFEQHKTAIYVGAAALFALAAFKVMSR